MGEKRPDTGLPVPFRYKGYTYNRKTQQGGEVVEFPEATLLTEEARPNPRSIRARNVVQSNGRKPGKMPAGSHFRNATRNLLLPTGDKHRVIVYLMTEFNGMRVIL